MQEKVDTKGSITSLFGMLRHVIKHLPPHLSPNVEIDNHMLLVNGATRAMLKGESTNRSFARGDRCDIAAIDEAAAIEPTDFMGMWHALVSVARLLVLVYNPGSKDHKTYRLHKGSEAISSECIMEMDWTTDPRRPSDFLERQSPPYGVLTKPEALAAYCCKYGFAQTGNIWDVLKWDVIYDETTEDFAPRAERIRAKAHPVGGWDFGSGPSALCCAFGLIEMGETPVIWVDDERSWQQTQWRVAGADTCNVMAKYGGRHVHFGDPAGTNAESDQSNWIRNLNSAGVPLFRLDPGIFGTREGIEWMIKMVQTMLDEGRLRIHKRCRYLWACIENWRRDVPAGIDIDYLSRTYIGPRKDVHSHGANSLMYLVAGALLLIARDRRYAAQTARDIALLPEGAREKMQKLVAGIG